jgi:hypothetical protein
MACLPARLESQQAQQHHGQCGVLVGGQAELGAAMQAQAVKKLGLVGRQQARQPNGLGGFFVLGRGFVTSPVDGPRSSPSPFCCVIPLLLHN